ncbi:MAG: hypothetical protein RBT39_10220 [Azoarcus sp.]|jgi:hypothetical protein|nr:hypothetical protein [Azoarcus sp.]MDD2873403.1 hypothetical protein [Azoarcus sp.]MDX9837924.1 hypothetical protein [Azoarcus sp.]
MKSMLRVAMLVAGLGIATGSVWAKLPAPSEEAQAKAAEAKEKAAEASKVAAEKLAAVQDRVAAAWKVKAGK